MKKNKTKKGNKRKPGARLGQHLLTNRGIAAAVAAAAGITKGGRVLEIGPGGGMLTQELLLSGARVTAVEKDSGMVAILRERFAQEIHDSRLMIHEGDARTLTPDTVFPKGAYKIAANIPYYITGELLRESLSAKNKPETLVFLVQKEVAERVARSKKESILSLSVKAYGTPKYVKTVSRGSFNPPPSVDSAILAVENISGKNFKHFSEEDFFRVVKAGFAQKRKTLSGNLKKHFPPASVDNAFEKIDLEKNIRAEDVKLETWLALVKMLTA